jgi:predicted enzyme related to lactoylglutathione lyase
VILNVGDMGAQVAFYRDVMGFAIVYPQAAAGDLARETFVRFDTGGAFLVLHAGRAGRAQRDEPRLSFMTDDLDLARAVLVSRGVEVSRVRSPAPGVLVVDARDPEGNAFHVEARVPAQER